MCSFCCAAASVDRTYGCMRGYSSLLLSRSFASLRGCTKHPGGELWFVGCELVDLTENCVRVPSFGDSHVLSNSLYPEDICPHLQPKRSALSTELTIRRIITPRLSHAGYLYRKDHDQLQSNTWITRMVTVVRARIPIRMFRLTALGGFKCEPQMHMLFVSGVNRVNRTSKISVDLSLQGLYGT